MAWDVVVTAGVGVAGAALAAFAVTPWAQPASVAHSYVADRGELDPGDDLHILTWAVSNERVAWLGRRRRAVLLKLGGLLVAASGIGTLERFDAADLGALVLAAGALLILAAWMPYLSARSAFWERRKATAAARVDRAIRELGKGPEPLSLPRLYELNRRQLDQYQELTRKQETSAYRLCQVASVVALGVLVAGIVVALSTDAAVDKYVGGGLAGLGSALSAFLAATFFRAHQQASDQLNRYYLEPQRTGRLLAAERLAALDPAVAPEIVKELVASLMNWEMPGVATVPEASAPTPATRFPTRRLRRPDDATPSSG